MVGPHPVFIPLGLDGGPDADAEHQQVEQEGGRQSRDVESHVGLPAAAAVQAERTQCSAACRLQANPKNRLVEALGVAASGRGTDRISSISASPSCQTSSANRRQKIHQPLTPEELRAVQPSGVLRTHGKLQEMHHLLQKQKEGRKITEVLRFLLKHFRIFVISVSDIFFFILKSAYKCKTLCKKHLPKHTCSILFHSRGFWVNFDGAEESGAATV